MDGNGESCVRVIVFFLLDWIRDSTVRIISHRFMYGLPPPIFAYIMYYVWMVISHAEAVNKVNTCASANLLGLLLKGERGAQSSSIHPWVHGENITVQLLLGTSTRNKNKIAREMSSRQGRWS